MERRGLTRKEAAFLQRERVVRVATAGPDGPHVVPVCHVVHQGVIYFGSDRNGLKVRHIARTRRAALVADRYSENWGRLRGVSVRGRADILRAGPAFTRARALLYRKYPQYERQAALEPEESVIVRVRPTHVLAWDYGS